MILVDVYRLHEAATIPSYGTSLSACFDLSFYPSKTDPMVNGYDKTNVSIQRYICDGDLIIRPHDRLLIPTGLVFKIHQKFSVENFSDIFAEREELNQFSIRLHPRSGLALKRGLVLANSEGIVDIDYQQQVYILLTNISEVSQTIKVGERIAQAEIVTNEKVRFVEVTTYPQQYSERDSGFGSTGTM